MIETYLNPPHGGKLINRVLTEKEASKALEQAKNFPTVQLDEELVKDVKNIARGVYSPLMGFMEKDDFERSVHEKKLANGLVWSIPIVLSVSREKSKEFGKGSRITLVGPDNQPVALMTVEDMYGFDPADVAQNVYGTTDQAHPGVAYVHAWQPVLIGGPIDLIDNSKTPFEHVNLDPWETRVMFKEKGWKTVAGFQTRNAPHRAHEYLQRCALEICDGLFINPIIGRKKTGDFQDHIIIKAYTHMIQNYFPRNSAVFSILPAMMRYAGPREAIQHAIIRKNFGCTHFVVGRDHAGVGDYYGPFDAQKIFDTIEDFGIHILKFDNSFMCSKCGCMATVKTCGHADEFHTGPSGTKIRKLVQAGEMVPEAVMRPDVAKILITEKDVFVP